MRSLRDTESTGASITSKLLRSAPSSHGLGGDSGDDLGASRHGDAAAAALSSASFTPFGKKQDPLRALLLDGAEAPPLGGPGRLRDSTLTVGRLAEGVSRRAGSAVRTVHKAAWRVMVEGANMAVVSGSTTAGSTGFVTFNSLAAATTACQLTLSHKAYALQTKRAPDTSGLLWQASSLWKRGGS